MPFAPLHPQLHSRLLDYRAQKNFDGAKWIETKCKVLNAYLSLHKLSACIVNVSGGVDSATTLALVARAARMPGSPIRRFVGVCQPIGSHPLALNRGMDVIRTVGAESIVLDQTDIFSSVRELVEEATSITAGTFAAGQLKSYLRTPTVCFVAQLYTQQGTPAVVIGTGNKDEDGYLGYFCKAGDGMVDLQVISDLHKSEVYTVARMLGVPKTILEAPPSADLWAGQTDEEEIGMPYDFVELYTGYYLALREEAKLDFVQSISREAREQFNQYAAQADALHRQNLHKMGGTQNL